MVTLSLGNKKKVYRSIREAADATGIKYITLYMRYRKLGWKAPTAAKKPVRKYVVKASTDNHVAA